jgi:hypothetical protein
MIYITREVKTEKLVWDKHAANDLVSDYVEEPQRATTKRKQWYDL